VTYFLYNRVKIDNKMIACFVVIARNPPQTEGTITMRKYILILAVLAAVPFPGLAMAGDAEQAAGAVQLSDQELDNVSAAGLGKAGAPGQLMKQLRLQQSLVQCAHGNSCNAPGRTRGASSFAPGHNK
jgi:hypothetical protein